MYPTLVNYGDRAKSQSWTSGSGSPHPTNAPINDLRKDELERFAANHPRGSCRERSKDHKVFVRFGPISSLAAYSAVSSCESRQSVHSHSCVAAPSVPYHNRVLRSRTPPDHEMQHETKIREHEYAHQRPGPRILVHPNPRNPINLQPRLLQASALKIDISSGVLSIPGPGDY
jgi:hypothetical protein